MREERGGCRPAARELGWIAGALSLGLVIGVMAMMECKP